VYLTNQVRYFYSKKLLMLWVLMFLFAQQCPLTDGDAVYEARSLLGIEIAEMSACVQTQSLFRSSDPSKEALQSISTIYPNPAKSVVYVPVDLLGAQIQVVNQMGIVVIDQVIINSTLDIALLPSGTYTLRIQEAGKRPRNEKLVVMKD
jgi:hypothetical protein